MRCNSRAPRRLAVTRRGLTLLEVLVSLAIFLMALVALVRLVALGNERARDVREQTDALQKCQSKLAEVIVGSVPLSGQASGSFDADEDPDQVWTWSLDCEQGAVTNLWNVQVRVQRQRGDGTTAEVTLSQMVLDPSVRGSTVPNTTSGSSSSSSASGGTTSGGN